MRIVHRNCELEQIDVDECIKCNEIPRLASKLSEDAALTLLSVASQKSEWHSPFDKLFDAHPVYRLQKWRIICVKLVHSEHLLDVARNKMVPISREKF